jgi:hypothetical protein
MIWLSRSYLGRRRSGIQRSREGLFVLGRFMNELIRNCASHSLLTVLTFLT